MNTIQRQRLLLIVAGLCIAAFAGDRFIIEPLIEMWKSRSQQIADLNTRLTKGESLLARAKTLHEREREMCGLSLPADNTAAENTVLSSISDWAAASRLGVTGVRPRWIQDDADTLTGKRLEVRVSASGDLDKIAHFIHALESDAIPLRVEQLELRSRDDKGSELTFETQISSIKLAEAKP
jgi:hypothetical protein